MRSFATTIEEWWSDLGAPHLDDDVRARLVAAADEVLGGRPISEVLAARDAAVVDALPLHGAAERKGAGE